MVQFCTIQGSIQNKSFYLVLVKIKFDSKITHSSFNHLSVIYDDLKTHLSLKKNAKKAVARNVLSLLIIKDT